jgi:hypothetical protein
LGGYKLSGIGSGQCKKGESAKKAVNSRQLTVNSGGADSASCCKLLAISCELILMF